MVELVTNLCTSLPSAQGGKMRYFYLGTSPKHMIACSAAVHVSQHRPIQISEREDRIGGRR